METKNHSKAWPENIKDELLLIAFLILSIVLFALALLAMMRALDNDQNTPTRILYFVSSGFCLQLAMMLQYQLMKIIAEHHDELTKEEYAERMKQLATEYTAKVARLNPPAFTVNVEFTAPHRAMEDSPPPTTVRVE